MQVAQTSPFMLPWQGPGELLGTAVDGRTTGYGTRAIRYAEGNEMGRTVVETNVARAEDALRQLVLAQDVAGLQPWLSPALFFSDAAGQWLGGHPCLGEWSARRLQLTALEQGAVEMLVCGQLVLVSSDVRLGYAGEQGNQVCAMRLLRVWASCSSPAGVHLLSIGVLPWRGG